ncbi:MAG: DegV family protein [Lactococcus plantarum]|nr:DegV family protein [Lactococcus plantarum]MDN6070179.1 DegV family protein [Lactococcus plantarum]MDN6084609.1 DegV family protein [Lactococcus plantarum]
MTNKKMAILVDSGCDVPTTLAQANNIYEIPLKIIYETESFTDKVTITAEEIYDRLPIEIPKTSLPEGAIIQEIFKKIIADGYEQLIAITISSGLSGTFNSIRLIAQDFPQLETFMFDTKNIGIGAGSHAIKAAELIAQGASFEEITNNLSHSTDKSKIFFSVATLEYLQKGGRIGLVSAVLGNALKLNPIITCNEAGVYHTVAKSRGRKKSLEKTVSLVKEFVGNHQNVRLLVAHGNAEQEALALVDVLKKEIPQANDILVDQISPALVVHTGPGLIGLGAQLLD